MGDIDLGNSTYVLEELVELERAGFDKRLAYLIVQEEGWEMPEGVPEEARRMLRLVNRGEVHVSEEALWDLQKLAGSVRKE